MKIRIHLVTLVCGLMLVFVGGCANAPSWGGSRERHYANPLANGKTAVYDSNGIPQGIINGGESRESHRSWELNPIRWFGFGSLFSGGVAANDGEVVVAAPYQGWYPTTAVPSYTGPQYYGYSAPVYGYGAPTYGYGYPAVGFDIRIGPDGREHQYPRANPGSGPGQRGGGQNGYIPPNNGGQRGGGQYNYPPPNNGGGQRGGNGSGQGNGGGQGGQRGGGH